ncbi:lipoyl domain-containing protein [bacterium]|nr:lipoyl domain-containing protein [bacterium]
MAIKEFTLAFLADEIKDASFVGWLVKEGESVKEGDDLCEIVTDKASLVLSVPEDGKIASQLAKKGDRLENDTVLLTMEV